MPLQNDVGAALFVILIEHESGLTVASAVALTECPLSVPVTVTMFFSAAVIVNDGDSVHEADPLGASVVLALSLPFALPILSPSLSSTILMLLAGTEPVFVTLYE